jgi:hypothetical protein
MDNRWLKPRPEKGAFDKYTTLPLWHNLDVFKPNTPHLIPMDYFNNTSDVNICSTSFVPGEFEAYPFLGNMSATKEVSFQAEHTLADPCNMVEQPRRLASSQPSFGATAG